MLLIRTGEYFITGGTAMSKTDRVFILLPAGFSKGFPLLLVGSSCHGLHFDFIFLLFYFSNFSGQTCVLTSCTCCSPFLLDHLSFTSLPFVFSPSCAVGACISFHR